MYPDCDGLGQEKAGSTRAVSGCYADCRMSSMETSIPRPLAVVVVVGGPADLITATRQAAGLVAAARLENAEISSAATVVATHRPFAIVMSEDVYAFDSAEFEALARDVNATLIRVDASASASKLERALMPKLGQAFRKNNPR
jgi:hypothetical protein